MHKKCSLTRLSWRYSGLSVLKLKLISYCAVKVKLYLKLLFRVAVRTVEAPAAHSRSKLLTGGDKQSGKKSCE